jgi:hypothetical protein
VAAAVTGPTAQELAAFPAGAARILGATARAMVLDAAAAAGRIIERVADETAGRSPALSTLPVRLLILSDETGKPLLNAAAVTPALHLADRIFTDAAGVRVRLDGVTTVTEPAPTEMLDPRANRLLLLDHALGRTEFLMRHLPPRPALSVVGDPITVVVVRSISGRVTGCSLGMTADWVIVQAGLFDAGNPRSNDATVLAHELGHAVNLPHLRDRANLMNPDSTPPGRLRGTALRGWQAAVVAANRHVIPPA